jgi:flagellar motor protein MotB
MVALNPSGTSVGHEKKGYARGLILGLTMAETMLLLVFCLLLVAGAIIAKKQKELEAALQQASRDAAQVERLSEESKKLEKRVQALLEQVTGHKMPDEDWRKLVLAKDTVDQLEQQGLSAEEAVRLAEATVVVRDNNLTAEDVRMLLSAEERATKAEKKLSEVETELAKSTTQPKDLPPIISLSEANGYSFEVGSAELTPRFKAKLEGDIAHQIEGIVSKYDVDVIEVVGHTDEQPLSRQSNMDFELGRVLAGQDSVSKMQPGDNAGLGLARAISVTTILKGIPALSHLNILPMSGGQLILPDDRLTDGAHPGDAPARRRIEIRVRKSKHKLKAEGGL